MLVRRAAARFAAHDSDIARTLVSELAGLSPSGDLLGPSVLPVCDALEAIYPAPDGSLLKEIRDYRTDLAWRMPGFGRLPETVSSRMGVVEFVGPDGMLAHERVRLGLLLQGAGVAYPPHRHAAEELYLVLAGTADWCIDQGKPVSRGPGSFVWHKPGQLHSMRTGSEPMLALWGWTGDVRSASYSA